MTQYLSDQPLYRDELAGLYAQYRVIKSKIKVTPVTSGTANVLPAFWGVYLDNDAVLTYALATSIMEDSRLGGSTSRPAIHTGLTGSLNASEARFNGSRSASFTIRKLDKDSRDVTHANGVSPTNLQAMEYQIWAGSIAGNDPGTLQFLVELSFTVSFTEPIVQTPS